MITKHSDRAALLKDANYFANELVARLERLEEVEPSPRLRFGWQQAASLVRRVRAVGRHEADEPRRKANRKANRPQRGG